MFVNTLLHWSASHHWIQIYYLWCVLPKSVMSLFSLLSLRLGFYPALKVAFG